MKIKKGDKVIMMAGKDRGKDGKVLRALPATRKVVVEGLNLIKKHQKPRQQGEKGQLVEIPRAVDASNVRVICPACSKPTRIGYQISKDGKKNRICKKCKQQL